MQDLITFPEIARLLTEELGEPISEKRIENAIKAIPIVPKRVKPGRGSVGGNPRRAILYSQIETVRDHIKSTKQVSKKQASSIFRVLYYSNIDNISIAEHCGVDPSTVSKWSTGAHHMQKVHYDKLVKLLESL